MKAFVLAVVLLGLSSQAFAATQPEENELLENEARFLYYNGSSTAAAITLLGALILLGVIAYLIYVGVEGHSLTLIEKPPVLMKSLSLSQVCR